MEGTSGVHFDAVEVPGKGARLTITPGGLARCGRIVLLVVGASKAKKIAEVFSNPDRPALEQPVNLFSAYPEKVTWLLDPAAASGLG
jgi:6-phosphogluconolactonase